MIRNFFDDLRGAFYDFVWNRYWTAACGSLAERFWHWLGRRL